MDGFEARSSELEDKLVSAGAANYAHHQSA